MAEILEGMLENVEEIRAKDFPFLDKTGRVYLDSTATAQMPNSVREKAYQHWTNNLRGSNHSKNSYEAKSAGSLYEDAKNKIKSFFGAENYGVIMTTGTTASSNLCISSQSINQGDLVLLTEMEHNSQIVTPRNLARKQGADVAYVKVDMENGGRLDLNHLENILKRRSDGRVFMNLVHTSNFTGVVNPVLDVRNLMDQYVGDRGFIYLDMAQSAGHMPINLAELGVDAAGFSAHKMYGPMGVGGLLVHEDRLEKLGPMVSGGGAVKFVSPKTIMYSEGVDRFEPGTQNLEGAFELGLVLDYLSEIGMDNIEAHDEALGKYFLKGLRDISEVKIYGPENMDNRMAVFPFNIGHALFTKNYDAVARGLNEQGVSVRDGCFCAHLYVANAVGVPKFLHNVRGNVMGFLSQDTLKLPGAVRASFSFYNTVEEANRALDAINDIASGEVAV